MGLSRYLRGTIASFLRPWILQKNLLEAVVLHIRLWQIVVKLQFLDMDCDFINAYLLSNSPFLLRNAHLDHAQLTISFFRSPGVSLIFQGLHFVFQIRPPDDNYWVDEEKRRATARKMEAIAALDPQGASVHSAVERYARERSTSWKSKVFVKNLLLQALQLEVQNASAKFYSNDPHCCNSWYSLALRSWEVPEGHGLARAFLTSLAHTSQEKNYSFCKVSSIEELGLLLPMSKDTLGRLKPASSNAGFEDMESSSSTGETDLLMWKSVTLNTEFQQNGELKGTDAFFAETVIQFGLADVKALVIAIDQLQGASKADHSQTSQHVRKGARHRWQRLYEKITNTSCTKFENVVKVGLLRQRYSQLYASWLLKLKDGVIDDNDLQGIRKGLRGKKLDWDFLEQAISDLEGDLPIEAIVLARFFGRSKVLTDGKSHVIIAQPWKSAFHSKITLSGVWQVTKNFLWSVVGMVKGPLSILSTFLMELFYYPGIKEVLLTSMKGVSWLRRNLSFKSKAHHGYCVGRLQLPEAFPEFLDKSRLFRSNVMGGRAYFNSAFHLGSITFADSAQCFARNHESHLFRRVNPSNENNLLGVHLNFGNLSVMYSSQATALGFKLVCGHVQGYVATVPTGSLNTDKSMKTQMTNFFMKNKGDAFLQTCPAPQIQLPEIVKSQFNNFESILSLFLNFIGKYNLDKGSEATGRPFVVFSYENSQSSCNSYGRIRDTRMCSLAVGCVICKLDLETYIHLGLLILGLLNTFNVNKQPVADKVFRSEDSLSIVNAERSDWEVLYADQLRQFLSTLVLKKEIWLSLALAGPRFEFSGLLQRSSYGKGRDIGAPSGPDLLMDLGNFEWTMWPAMGEQDDLHPEKYVDGMKLTLDRLRERRTWLEKLPSPSITGEEFVQGSSQHDEIGNNAIVSIQGAVLSLSGSHHSEEKKLFGPVTSVLRFSLCRDHFISSSGIYHILSAAAVVSCSSMQVEILLEEVELLFEAFNEYSRTSQEFLSIKNMCPEAGFAMKQELKHSNKSFVIQGNFPFLPEHLYYAVSAEVKVDKFGCIISDTGIISGEHLSENQKLGLDDSQDKCLEELDRSNQRDQILVSNLWLNFSWGDGCSLLSSSGLDELSVIIFKNVSECGISGEKLQNTLLKRKSVAQKPNEDNVREAKMCQLLLQRLFFRIFRPRFLPHLSSPVAPKDDTNILHTNRDCQTSLVFQMEKFHIYDDFSDDLMSKALSRLHGASCFAIHVKISNDNKQISILSKGGLFFLHTKALHRLLQELRGLLSPKKVSAEANNGKVDLTSHSNSPQKDEGMVFPSSFGRSLSLPLQTPQERPFHQKRLLSAPLEPCIHDVQETSTACSETWFWLPEEVLVEISSSYVVLAQNRTIFLEDVRETSQGALLLEVGARLLVHASTTRQTVHLEASRFCCSFLWEEKKVEESTRNEIQVPQFGSNHKPHMKGSDKGHTKNGSNLIEDGKMTAEIGHHVLKGDEKDLSKGLIMQRENDFILENLNLSFKLENHLGHFDGWSGFCNVLGLDIRITIPEAQFLLALISAISSLPQVVVKDKSKESKISSVKPSKPASDSLFQIPDGSIIAVKDAQEHLYMAVEKTHNNNFRLAGVLHYSLVGQRALFKVKYQNDVGNTSQRWFSLLSISAKNADGEAMRVHYRPGSGLADISSSCDGSWELWQTHPFKHISKEGDGDIDLYSDLNRNLLYLVNQKSKQGLSLASGAPAMVKQPGSPFKFKVLQLDLRIQSVPQSVLQMPDINSHESKSHFVGSAASIPQVELKMGQICFSLLHESGGGKYLLPLLRASAEESEGVIHIQPLKIRLIAGCKFTFEYLEAHVNQWYAIIQPIEVGLFYRMQIGGECPVDHAKLPASFFGRCKRVDISISEKSLDAMLFVIGVLRLAGPYSIKYSPVLATSCLVENSTGLDLCCSFDSQEHKEFVKIPAWSADTFFIRNLISRSDLGRVKTLSSVSVNLEKIGVGLTSLISASLLKPSLTATRTRLERKEGHKRIAGPIVVVEVSKDQEDGVFVSVSPMTRIRNCSGLSVELRCRRPNGGTEGASVFLKDGDIVDDAMGAFDALHLRGELKKALSSFGLGDFLLSIRPVGHVPAFLWGSNDDNADQQFDWSEDIKGAKPVPILGFFEKLQYGFKKSFKGQTTPYSFGTVFCSLNPEDKPGVPASREGMHILIRFTVRRVPLISPNPDGNLDSSQPVAAWQEQKELVLLPTLCVHNFLEMKISLSKKPGAGRSRLKYHSSIECCSKAFLFEDLTELVFAIELDELSLKSKDISINEWSRSVDLSSSFANRMKELEKDLDFGDNNWCVKLKIFYANDGILQVLVYSPYALKNSSDTNLLVCMQKQSKFHWKLWNREGKASWPVGETGTVLMPGAKMSLLQRSSYMLVQIAEEVCETASLDLESFSGTTELNIKIDLEDGLTEEVLLGVRMEVAAGGSIDPTRTINIGSRYIVLNDSQEAIFVCQDGLQQDENAVFSLKAGDHISLKTRFHPEYKQKSFGYSQFVGSDIVKPSVCSIRIRFQKDDWEWTGPVCASAIGSFSLRVHKRPNMFGAGDTVKAGDENMFKFVSVDVEDKSPSLVIHVRIQSADLVPYRIENALSQASIYFYQKGLDDVVTTLEPRQTISYAWDDLSQPHKVVVGICGTQLHDEIKLDKLGPWKSFRALRQKGIFGLRLPFENQPESKLPSHMTSGDSSLGFDSVNAGYEIDADGFQRVLHVCEDALSSKLTKWQSRISFPSARMDFRVPLFGITLVDTLKHKDQEESNEKSEGLCKESPSPIISMRLSNIFGEILTTQKHYLFQMKVETLSVDERWQGAPFAAMLRVHSEDRFKKGETVLHMAAIISNQTSNPIHVKYSSVLLQTIDVNLDEETLLKLVPFYRYSLAESGPSRQLYFERLEIHPIKIVASFIPGQPSADYTSMQEAFRTLLHSFIKVPSIRGSIIELNGVLLTHALMTFRQLGIKCAQHYSWYAMRAIYVVKGSKLLPPAFTSLFDDSAASSLDVFFDPSNGSVDVQGLTLGMFNFLSDGLKNRGFSGTSRYIGDLERTMKTAGSNILFAILTEVSDNVLKGAETGGLDGMVNGFRRGILNVSMEPSLLRTAVVKGGSSRRIKLDHSPGTDETYVEGYLQAMLDTLYQQNYLKVKVVDDQVLLKNLPPNSILVDEIMGNVKRFLVREGLLAAAETPGGDTQSWRRLRGETDKRIVPAAAALCEQLFVIFAVRALRNRARSWFLHSKLNPFLKKESDGKGQTDTGGQQEQPRGVKGILFTFVLSSAMAYIDGRLCRHIPNTLARRIVSGFLLSFVE